MKRIKNEEQKKQGTAQVTVKLYFNTDLTNEEIQEVVQNVDYNFNHHLISETKITDIDI